MIGAIELRDALPKTPVGKLSKKTLVDEEEAKRSARTA
jgi:long-chain acyl-CoA synthetase